MFDLFGEPPADWEPIPDSVLAELPCLDDTDPAPEGMSPAISCPDDLVWQALERDLGVETLPLIAAAPLRDLSPAGLSRALRRLDELHRASRGREGPGYRRYRRPGTGQ